MLNSTLSVVSLMESFISIFSIEGVDVDVLVTFIVVFVASLICLFNVVKYMLQALETTRARGNEFLITQPPQPSYNRSEEPCPVCFGIIHFAVETDCYHLFCGTCIQGLLQYSRHRKVTCPVCRAQVSMLYPVFSVIEHNSERSSDIALTRDNLISEIQEYNQLFSGGRRTILQTILELPIYVRRLWRTFNNPNDIFVQTQMRAILYIILILVILYILFPFDLFPEVHFGILGFLDDLLVVAISLLYITNVYRSLYFNLGHQVD